jgi:hypothetical protein
VRSAPLPRSAPSRLQRVIQVNHAHRRCDCGERRRNAQRTGNLALVKRSNTIPVGSLNAMGTRALAFVPMLRQRCDNAPQTPAIACSETEPFAYPLRWLQRLLIRWEKHRTCVQKIIITRSTSTLSGPKCALPSSADVAHQSPLHNFSRYSDGILAAHSPFRTFLLRSMGQFL